MAPIFPNGKKNWYELTKGEQLKVLKDSIEWGYEQDYNIIRNVIQRFHSFKNLPDWKNLTNEQREFMREETRRFNRENMMNNREINHE
jgi:hypothetical protein